MQTVTATEFMKNFGRHNSDVQREPIAITNHGRVTGYYVSAYDFEEMQKKLAAMRKSYTLNTMPDEMWGAFMESKVDPEYDYLNELLEDEPAAAEKAKVNRLRRKNNQ